VTAAAPQAVGLILASQPHMPLATLEGVRYIFHPYASEDDTCFHYSDGQWYFAKHRSTPFICSLLRSSHVPRWIRDHLVSLPKPSVYEYQETIASPSLLSSLSASEVDAHSLPRINEQLSRYNLHVIRLTFTHTNQRSSCTYVIISLHSFLFLYIYTYGDSRPRYPHACFGRTHRHY
jgi:hypothetical protein